MATRIIYPNRVADAASSLAASSADSAAPLSWLRDQLRSKTWRSKLGWNVVSGVNDKLDFSDGSTRAATIAAGNYATGAAYATAVQTAMNAVSTTCVVSYNSGTGKFTVSRTGTLSLLWQSGANAATSCGKDLGFDVSANDTSASSYVADLAAYHSREWLKLDAGSALACAAAEVINHNSGAGGTYTLQGNATDAWTSPSFSQALTGDSSIRMAFFASTSLRYWRLLIDDVQNTAGYSEVGIWYAGPYVQPTVTYSADFSDGLDPLGGMEYAPDGAHFVDIRVNRKTWSLKWDEVLDADKAALLAAADALPQGVCLFLYIDPTSPTTSTRYGYFEGGANAGMSVNNYWTVPLVFKEALG